MQKRNSSKSKINIKRWRLAGSTIIIAGLAAIGAIHYATVKSNGVSLHPVYNNAVPHTTHQPQAVPPQERIGKPRMIYISKLKVQAKMQYVGKNKEGNM